MDIAAWLRGLGLERYEADFRDNEIDWAVLPQLTSDDLNDIGVTAVGHRRKLLDAIAGARRLGGYPRHRLRLCLGRIRPPGRGRAAAADRDVLRSGRLDAAVHPLRS